MPDVAVATPTPGPSPEAIERRATAQGRPRLALAMADLSMFWRNTIRFTSALVIALFPLIFFYDEAAELSFSPVLPGLILLVLVLVVAPPLWIEFRTRRIKDLENLRKRVFRGVQSSWACLGLSLIWLLFWFSWGL